MDIEKIRLLREKLRLLERESNDRFRSDSGCCGLTLGQCHTLLEIGNKGQISLVELASRLSLDASTLSRTINGLVFLGLVNRLANEKDRRYIAISLSDQGRKVFNEIEKTFNNYFSGVLGLIPVEKREAVVESISLFSDALRKYNDSAGCCQEEPPSVKEEQK
jgi:DNA-binding MarR family transcriptional regulator